MTNYLDLILKRPLIALTLTGVAGSAMAQSSGSGGVLMEEIVVEAQRREQLVQDVPIAVTAYNREQLDQLQVTEALDMTRLVPNMVGHNNTGLGTANAYSLRGLNNTESIATFDPPVGTYIDDIYVARQNANNVTLFDVERIEVLRGPQGTLFGRNTTGGAIAIQMAPPQEELGGYAEAGVGSYDRYTLKGSIDVPFTDRILSKWSGYWIEDDGFVDQRAVDGTTIDDTINKEENWGVRGSLRFLITDDLTFDVAYEHTDEDHANLLNRKDGGSRITNTGLSQNSSNLVGLVTGDKQNFTLGNNVVSDAVTARLDWQVGDLGMLSFIGGSRRLDQDFALDFLDGPAPYGAFTIANEGEHDQDTLEIKWNSQLGDSIEYVAGFFYLDEDNTTDFGDIFDLGFPLVLADRVLENTTESFAFYTQADYAVTDQWTVTAGIRYTDEEKDIKYTDNQPAGDDTDLTTANIQALGIPTEQDTDLWTPRVAVQFQPTDNQMYYASATRGFKSGGWNARGTSPDTLLPFDKEVVWSYEAGMKTEWLDNTLRFNLAGFYSDISDFQLPSASVTPIGSIVFITDNFADLEVLGLEAELIWAPTDGLTTWANIGIMDGEYQNIDQSIKDQQAACQGGDAASCGAGIVNDKGEIADPTRIPDYTLNLGANYVWAIGSAYEVVPSAYIYSVGDHSVGTSGTPESLVDGYTTWNGSVAFNMLDYGVSIIAECKNCNDRTMVVSTLAGQQYFQDPRTWMLRVNWDFGGRR